MVRIQQILPGTIADELSLEIGSRVVRINGEPVRDSIDFRFLETDETIEVEVIPALGGLPVLYDIEKDAGESLGIVPAPDAVRECANKCVFCFIDGNPEHVRRSLYMKDDDFRLSFTYGNYVTLTNLGPKGFQRLIDQRLSPLYVSVHATEPSVRERILGVPRGGDIVEQLRRLVEAGIEVHTQVVLCPGWNDGAHLDRTIDDLWALGPEIVSLSVVPVGLTRYNVDRPVRHLTIDEQRHAIAQMEAARARALAERGTGWAYAADEMFLGAGLPVPAASYYDDWPLTENGVGSVRSLIDAFEAGLPTLPRMDGRRVAIVTGTRMGQVMAPLVAPLEAQTGARVDLMAVENRLFGSTVTTAGLLPGADMRDAVLSRGVAYDLVLIPGETLNDDDRFIDDMPFATFRDALGAGRVLPAHELISALAAPHTTA
jgi:putative radical SAM enzyme (TIGR03279 family)